MRVGIGYDVHRLVKDKKLIIGGIEIDYAYGLKGHSDADVLIHAIIDSLLGAAGLGDIGRLFPDTDKKYEGISSLKLLDEAIEKVEVHGYRIKNIDSTIIAQKPKLSKYIPEMEKKLADILKIEIKDINIKATTTEKLGYIGENKAIAAEAVSLIYY